MPRHPTQNAPIPLSNPTIQIPLPQPHRPLIPILPQRIPQRIITHVRTLRTPPCIIRTAEQQNRYTLKILNVLRCDERDVLVISDVMRSRARHTCNVSIIANGDTPQEAGERVVRVRVQIGVCVQSTEDQ